MPVDKFGRNGDRATPVYTEINIANLTNTKKTNTNKFLQILTNTKKR